MSEYKGNTPPERIAEVLRLAATTLRMQKGAPGERFCCLQVDYLWMRGSIDIQVCHDARKFLRDQLRAQQKEYLTLEAFVREQQSGYAPASFCPEFQKYRAKWCLEQAAKLDALSPPTGELTWKTN
jgi:hypothetical protein